ncbi:36989_t:CDS:1 [Gigaspora margarita]|uniref:36989_t:CDS:1 n=1 Tax=Gigaspora margarita TaxID=4874 RepID=A0ABN7V580_GIGMA|nr:36989_t:CDS:1 [Gigaspora margarita]
MCLVTAYMLTIETNTDLQAILTLVYHVITLDQLNGGLIFSKDPFKKNLIEKYLVGEDTISVETFNECDEIQYYTKHQWV